MTLAQKIYFIREERHQDLSQWEREFIEDIYEGIDGMASDELAEEYLTSRQIEKIEEIWENLGL